MITCAANNITNLFRILSDEFVTDVPVCLADHICKKYGLYLIHKENLSHSLEHFIDWIAKSNVAGESNRAKNRYDRSNLVA